MVAALAGDRLGMLAYELGKEVVRLAANSSGAAVRRARNGWVLVWLAMWMVGPAAAGGQSKDVFDLGPEELKNVQVYSASMYLQSDREAPSSVTIIRADQIRQFGYRTLADILRSVRGFDVTYDRNYAYVGVRGFSRPGGYNDDVLLLVNGHRLNDNVYNSAQIGTEFPLDIDLISRIEIVRGPSSSLYGTSAFLAVINVITKTVQSLDGAELSGEAGGFGYYRLRSTLAGRYHGVEGIFSGSIYDSAGPGRLFFPAYDTPATDYGIARNLDDDSSSNLYGRLHFRDFSFESLFSTRDKGIPTASFDQVFNDARSHTVDSSGHLELRYSHSVFHDAELIASVYYDRAIYHAVYVYPPLAGLEKDGLNHEVQNQDVLNEDGSRETFLVPTLELQRRSGKNTRPQSARSFETTCDRIRRTIISTPISRFSPIYDARKNGRPTFRMNSPLSRV